MVRRNHFVDVVVGCALADIGAAVVAIVVHSPDAHCQEVYSLSEVVEAMVGNQRAVAAEVAGCIRAWVVGEELLSRSH